MLNLEKLNVSDEIIDGEAKYKITDSKGETILESCEIEVINNILQYGTPINKALFDRADNNFESIMKQFNLNQKSGLEIYLGW